MNYYIEQGLSRKDCELKIMEKYKRPFHILSEKPIRLGGFFGMFSKPGIEVEFYFSPVLFKNSEGSAAQAPLNFEEEKKKVLAAAGKNSEQTAANNNETSNQILESLREIREFIGGGSAGRKDDHPAFIRAAELLKLNDFSEKYIDKMCERLRKELPLEKLDNPDTVQNCLLEWIGESISIFSDNEIQRKPGVMVLVGPTGVGKTTTIAKLAAIFGLGTEQIPAVSVRMITIDAYRICAKDQLIAIGDLMELPVSCVENRMALKKEIALYSDETDLFLIDTIGNSPKDSSKLGEMKEILDGCGRGALVHLVLSAGTKTSDIYDILRQFEPFNYKSVVLTKLDETEHIGNVISALSEKGKSVSYITDGQTIPVDIKKASIVRFLINLDGFKVDRDKIEKRFPVGEADQFKWR